MDPPLPRRSPRLAPRATLALGLGLVAGVLAVFAQWAWARSGAATAILAMGLAAATILARRAARVASVWPLVGLALGLLVATGALGWHLGGEGLAQVPQAASLVVMTWLAWAVLAVLVACGLRGPQALALVVSVAASLWVVVGIFLPISGSWAGQPPYHFEVGGPLADPARGYRVRSFSRARQYFPDDPRGYFDFDPRAPHNPWRVWQLAFTAENPGRGDWTLLDSENMAVRIDPPPAVPEVPWSCQWIQRELPLPEGAPGELEFEARADAPRPLEWKLYPDDDQTGPGLGQATFELQPEWRTFRATWSAPPRATKATCYLNLAASGVPLELRRWTLRAARQPIHPPPRVTPHYLEYQFNAQGFREREVATPCPPGVTRVVCLGDSVIYGQGVRFADTFSQQLERLLNEVGPAPVRYEVLNCGLSGYSPTEERACLEEIAPLYHPQLVILSLFVNDDEPLVAAGPSSVDSPAANDAAGLPRLAEPAPHDEDYERGREQLARLCDYCQQRGIRLVGLLLRAGGWGADWQRLRDRLCGVLDDRKVPWLDVGPPLLARHPPEDLMVHPRDGHPNEVAHRLAAEQMAEFLHTHQLLPPPAEEAGSTASPRTMPPPAAPPPALSPPAAP